MIGVPAAPTSQVPVAIGAAPTAFSLKEYDGCEIVGGALECWGATFDGSATLPTSVSATSVSVGAGSACVITTGENVVCIDARYASPVTVF